MRWRTLGDREPHPIHWLWIWAPALFLLVLVVGPLLAIEWLVKKKRAYMGPSGEWQRWFAWYPVKLEFSTESAWLEWTERRLCGDDVDHRPVTAGERGES